MSDITISLIVITLTGSFIALLFVTISRKNARQELEIKEYCQSSGYLFSRSDEPLRKEVSIKGNTFVLTSTMSSMYHDAQTGSDSWNRVSVWSTQTHDAERPEFLLGSVSASTDWESLPAAIRDTAMQVLLSEGGEGYTSELSSIIKTSANRAFLLFQRTQGSAEMVVERILPMLDKCPAESRVVIHSEKCGINVNCSNLFIRSLDDVRTLMDLGFACAGFTTI